MWLKLRNTVIHANSQYVTSLLFINQSINIPNAHSLSAGWGRRKKRKGGKLDDRWLGPYQVSKDLGKGFYSLTNEEKVTVVERVNGAHLKIYDNSCERRETQLRW